MAKVKTVVTTSGETVIQLDDHYSYAWIRNIGSGDCYVSVSPDIVAGADDVLSLKAGSIVRLTTKADVVYVKGATTVEVYAQNFSDCPFEKFGGEAGEIVIEPLSVTENGTYTAPTGTDGYSPVSVTVPQTTVTPLSVTQNGTYTAPSGTAYSPVVVDVQEQPWSPLQDGYSNFWFELTNDTLSPWLNFSAKNSDAVIDWGDGSGEVALDTLTPTHTYAKAGKYVVKVKGVTGITQQYSIPLNAYNAILTAVELSNEVSALLSYAFAYQFALKNVVYSANLTTIGIYAFYSCSSLQSISPIYASQVPNYSFMNTFSLRALEFSNSVTALNTSILRNMYSIQSITIPESVTAIGAYFANSCNSISEIHMRPTTPPTLGLYSFTTLPNDYIIYVPTGTGDTYKAASGWSTYADHILEEGEVVTRAMQRKFAREAKEIEEDTGDMR